MKVLVDVIVSRGKCSEDDYWWDWPRKMRKIWKLWQGNICFFSISTKQKIWILYSFFSLWHPSDPAQIRKRTPQHSNMWLGLAVKVERVRMRERSFGWDSGEGNKRESNNDFGEMESGRRGRGGGGEDPNPCQLSSSSFSPSNYTPSDSLQPQINHHQHLLLHLPLLINNKSWPSAETEAWRGEGGRKRRQLPGRRGQKGRQEEEEGERYKVHLLVNPSRINLDSTKNVKHGWTFTKMV